MARARKRREEYELGKWMLRGSHPTPKLWKELHELYTEDED